MKKYLLLLIIMLQVNFVFAQYQNQNNNSNGASLEATKNWILRYLKESAKDKWQELNGIGDIANLQIDKVWATFDNNGNFIFVMANEREHTVDGKRHEPLFGSVHWVSAYDILREVSYYIIPISKIKEVECDNFKYIGLKTLDDDIVITSIPYYIKFAKKFEEPGCSICINRSIALTRGSYSTEKTKQSRFGFPRAFENPVIDNYIGRMVEAFRHLVILNKQANEDNTF